MVQGIIAGGYGAIFKSVEGAEDNGDLGKSDLAERKVTSSDVVCGIAASGRTPSDVEFINQKSEAEKSTSLF